MCIYASRTSAGVITPFVTSIRSRAQFLNPPPDWSWRRKRVGSIGAETRALATVISRDGAISTSNSGREEALKIEFVVRVNKALWVRATYPPRYLDAHSNGGPWQRIPEGRVAETRPQKRHCVPLFTSGQPPCAAHPSCTRLLFLLWNPDPEPENRARPSSFLPVPNRARPTIVISPIPSSFLPSLQIAFEILFHHGWLFKRSWYLSRSSAITSPSKLHSTLSNNILM